MSNKENTGKYINGETPKVGDVVELVDNNSNDYYMSTINVTIAVKQTVKDVQSSSSGANIKLEGYSNWYRANRFELVSREDGYAKKEEVVELPNAFLIVNETAGVVEKRVATTDQLEKALFELFQKRPTAKYLVYGYYHTVSANMQLKFDDGLALATETKKMAQTLIDFGSPESLGSTEMSRDRTGMFRKT